MLGFHGSPLYGQPAWWGQDSAENTVSSIKEDGIIAKGEDFTLLCMIRFYLEVICMHSKNCSSDVVFG